MVGHVEWLSMYGVDNVATSLTLSRIRLAGRFNIMMHALLYPSFNS